MVKKRSKKNAGRKIFEMTCKSCPKEISCIEEFLQKINSTLKLDDGSMHRLLVSCTEALNNAIIHGNRSDSGKEVRVKCLVGARVLTVRIKDGGSGFDPSSLLDPRDEKNLLKENGRGVFLMRSLMDKVAFKRLKSGFVVEMKLNLH
jgi:serine/threonine-protein kinase RsbW